MYNDELRTAFENAMKPAVYQVVQQYLHSLEVETEPNKDLTAQFVYVAQSYSKWEGFTAQDWLDKGVPEVVLISAGILPGPQVSNHDDITP